MSFKEFVNELSGKRVEGEIIKTILISLVVSFATFVLFYYLRFRNINNFIQDYGLFIFLIILSCAIIMPGIRQVRAFKVFPCMTGMMIGMTFGMISGFLFGFYIGATNGMFWGSVFGMAVGISLGVWKGRCCGVMGIMEGLMAGFMGGLMGAMTAVMMYNDNLRAASVIIFVICAAIIIGLNYMLYKETKNEERLYFENQFLTVILSFFITSISLWFMVLGPKSVLFT